MKMGKFKGKHIVEEIENIRCTIIESGITIERVNFLKEILEFNKFEVKIEKEKNNENSEKELFRIGVTDLIFNPSIAIFERKLKTKEGKSITPEFWFEEATEIKPYYWKK
jgi:hypothetical protein